MTTPDELLIKTENKITFRQKLKNNQRVVGFVANWVYLLTGTEVETIQGEISLRSIFLNQFLAQKHSCFYSFCSIVELH